MDKKLNLGCGTDIKEGYINLDSLRLPGVDVIHNLNKYPYPFKDNTFDEVEANMILEHLDDWLRCMKELRRICKPNAVINLRVPFFPSMYAVSDPTHKHFFTYQTFEYISSAHHKHIFGDIKAHYFKVEKIKIVFSWNRLLAPMNWIVNLHPMFYQRYIAGILPSNEIKVRLKVWK
jgi:predicted SAM-dependent methyltransferase